MKVTSQCSNDDVTPMTSSTNVNYDVIDTLFEGIVAIRGHDRDSYPGNDTRMNVPSLYSDDVRAVTSYFA